MSDTKALIKYVRDRLNDGPNITFGKPTVCDLVDALEQAEAMRTQERYVPLLVKWVDGSESVGEALAELFHQRFFHAGRVRQLEQLLVGQAGVLGVAVTHFCQPGQWRPCQNTCRRRSGRPAWPHWLEGSPRG